MSFGAFEEDKDKKTLTGLQNAAGDGTSPSEPTGSAASQGALGAPAQAGATPAFADRGMIVGDDIRDTTTSARYKDMWDDPSTTDEMKDETEAEMDKSLSAGGSGTIAKTNEVIANTMKNGDMPTLSLLLDWGWTPESERSDDSGAFAGKKNLGSEYTVQEGDQGALGAEIVPGEEKPKWDRRQMGGFLMEFGLRMLASNRETGGEAFGEAAIGTMDAREERRKTKATEDLATAERKRTQRREDEADLHRREKEKRDVRASELREKDEKRKVREEGRKAKEAKRKGLVQTTNEAGEVFYGEIKAGYIVDPDTGEKMKATSAILSASGTRAARDALAGAKQTATRDLDKAIAGGPGSKDPEVRAMKYEKDQAKLDKLRKAWIKKRVDSFDYAAKDDDETVEYLEYNPTE